MRKLLAWGELVRAYKGLLFCVLGLATSLVCVADGGPAGAAALFAQAASSTKPPVMVLGSGQGPLGAGYFAVLANAPLDLTVEQITLSPPAGFVPFQPRQTYQLSKDNALWLHFRVQREKTDSTDWTVVLSKPFIDQALLYYQDAQGVWRTQAAGTRVAHHNWPVHGLTPQFRLGSLIGPATAQGADLDKPRDFYIRIQKWIPLRFDVEVQRTERVSEQTQSAFLTVGVLLGLLGFMFVAICLLYALYRHTAYAWYAAYAAAAFMASASFSGAASYIFWPSAVVWPAISTMMFVLFGLAAQLGFTRAIFIAPDTPPFWPRLLMGTLLAMLLASGVFLAVDDTRLRLALFSAALPVSMAVIATIAVRALSHDKPVASLYLLSFLPMGVLIGLTQIEQLGVAALPWLHYDAPIYGLILELPLLLIALHLHVRSNHASRVRKLTLAELDPLTGFLAPLHFPDKLAYLWSQARNHRQDIAIAYVLRIDADPGVSRHAVPASSTALVQRCVRMLRMVTRQNDIVALIGKNMYALLMPGMSLGPNFSGKLSRLVALGLMHDADDATGQPVKFRIAATSLGSFSGTSSQLDRALKQQLLAVNAATQRNICFVQN